MTAKWNYRSLDQRLPNINFGPDGYQYLKARTTLDLTFSYQLTRRLTLAGGVTNLFHVPFPTNLVYGAQTPGYARQLEEVKAGVPMVLTLKGIF